MRSARVLVYPALVLAASAGSFATNLKAAELDRTVTFHIPAQPLDSALLEFSRQANIPIVIAPKAAEGLRAGTLRTTATAGAALTDLLRASGLRYREVNGTVTIAPAKSRDEKTTTAYASQELRLADAGGGAAGSPVSDGDSNSTRDSQHPHDLAEVVVTAQKREERLIDTPQSVSNLSSEDLNKLGATQLRDFANTVPGLSITSDGPGFSQVTLRGVTTGNLPVSPTVGIYVDDVPIGSTSAFGFGGRFGLDVGLFDVDRIEVLRGPQGTLYGASTMGGLIKYVSKSPDMSNFSGDVQVGSSGTYSGGASYNGAAAVNIPLVSNELAARASVFYSHDGGYIDNVALGEKDVNRANIYGARLDVLFKPLDALSIRVGGFAQNISRDGQASEDYSFTGVPLYGALDQYRLFAEPLDQHFRLVSVTIKYDFGPVALTSISGYQTMQTDQVYDFSAAYEGAIPGIAAVGLPDNTRTDKFTQEVRLASQGEQTLDWLIGGFFTHESSVDEESFLLRDAQGQSVPNNLFIYSAPSDYKEAAAFANLTYHITHQLDVSGGIRFARDEQSSSEYTTGLYGDVSIQTQANENSKTYLADARYHFNDHSTGYLRYATGYRPGGPNFVSYDPTTGQPLAPATFAPDSLKSYEAGYKVETADRRYSVDVDGYYIRWSNIQINTTAGGFTDIVNVPGGATIRGAELTVIAHPVDRLSASGAFAYQNARLSEADFDLGAAQGERLPNVPRFTAAVNADYQILVNSVRPSIGATFRYVSNRTAAFNNAVNNPAALPQFYLPSYTSLDLRNEYTLGSVNLQLYVHNVFNQHGLLSADTNYGPVAQVTITQPRTAGLNAWFHF